METFSNHHNQCAEQKMHVGMSNNNNKKKNPFPPKTILYTECKLATSELWEALGKPDFNLIYSKQKVTLFKSM